MFTLPYAWVAVVALIGAVEQSRLDQLIRASAQLNPGDSEARVVDVLGQPLERWQRRDGVAWLLFGSAPPQWGYGTVVDVGEIVNPESAVPNPLPINLRLFDPDEDDLVVTWDENGAVASVVRP